MCMGVVKGFALPCGAIYFRGANFVARAEHFTETDSVDQRFLIHVGTPHSMKDFRKLNFYSIRHSWETAKFIKFSKTWCCTICCLLSGICLVSCRILCWFRSSEYRNQQSSGGYSHPVNEKLGLKIKLLSIEKKSPEKPRRLSSIMLLSICLFVK